LLRILVMTSFFMIDSGDEDARNVGKHHEDA
jgi:hypothetical protein